MNASQRGALQNIYGQASRNIFAPIERERNAAKTTSPFTSASAENHILQGKQHGQNVQNGQTRQQSLSWDHHYRVLSALDSRLEEIQEYNQRLLAHLQMQNNHISKLEERVAKKNDFVAKSNSIDDWRLLMQQQHNLFAQQRQSNLNWQRQATNQHLAPSDTLSSSTTLWFLSAVVLVLLLLIVAVLIMQWRRQTAATQLNNQSNQNQKQDIERAVYDVLSRSLLSQNQKTANDTNASSTVFYGP